MSLPVRFLRFEELATALLYEILALRQRVFIIEQHCFYLDCDGLDKQALHAVVFDSGKLIAYARILPPGTAHESVAIGRMAVDEAYRGRGVGKTFMQQCMTKAIELYGPPVVVASQKHAEPFYRQFGFEPVGTPYEEAGVPHIKMRYAA